MRIKDKKKIVLWIYFGVAAFVVMMLATRSSFLYPCNNWDDANSYFSVGKSLFNGKMPYRDVFDQKGMMLYFLYGLCYLVSHTTFAGVFLMEVFLAFFDILGFYKILSLYMKKSLAAILAPMPLALVFCSYSFYWGGSAEEICFPFLVWGLYLGLRYFKTEYPEKEMSKKTLFVAGILAGIVANIKFTVLGLFFAWMMWVAFSYLVRKNIKGMLSACITFLLGMAAPFVPWFIYFGIQGGLYYWYWGYVYINVFLYSNLNGEGPALGERLYALAKIFYYLVIVNYMYYAVLIPGVLYDIFSKKQKLMSRLFLPILCIFTFLGIYIGGSELPYYALPLGVFTVMGFVLLGVILEWLYEKFAHTWKISKKALVTIGCLVSVGISAAAVYVWSVNIPYMQVKQEDIFLYKFKKIVEESENPTILNIGCLDAGLYTVCDVVPTCQWFQTQTINTDLVYKEQERYIKEGLIEYVIARDDYPEVIWEKYELVSEEEFDNGNMKKTYYLFRIK